MPHLQVCRVAVELTADRHLPEDRQLFGGSLYLVQVIHQFYAIIIEELHRRFRRYPLLLEARIGRAVQLVCVFARVYHPETLARTAHQSRLECLSQRVPLGLFPVEKAIPAVGTGRAGCSFLETGNFGHFG